MAVPVILCASFQARVPYCPQSVPPRGIGFFLFIYGSRLPVRRAHPPQTRDTVRAFCVWGGFLVSDKSFVFCLVPAAVSAFPLENFSFKPPLVRGGWEGS